MPEPKAPAQKQRLSVSDLHAIVPDSGLARHLIGLVLFTVAFALSIFFQGTQSILYAPAIIALFGTGLCLWLPAIRSGQWQVPVSATTGLALLFGLYTAASIFWSTIPYISVIFALIIGVLPFLFWCWSARRRPRG